MPATVIAERIGRDRSITVLKDRVRELRPYYLPPDPASRTEYDPGDRVQCDLWFAPVGVPLGGGRVGSPPVLVMVAGYSRMIFAVVLPTRQAPDLLAGHWTLLQQMGAAPRQLVWDNEAAVGSWRAVDRGIRCSTAHARPSPWLSRSASLLHPLQGTPGQDPVVNASGTDARGPPGVGSRPGDLLAPSTGLEAEAGERIPSPSTGRVRGAPLVYPNPYPNGGVFGPVRLGSRPSAKGTGLREHARADFGERPAGP